MKLLFSKLILMASTLSVYDGLYRINKLQMGLYFPLVELVSFLSISSAVTEMLKTISYYHCP
jgi:hypothetical protein